MRKTPERFDQIEKFLKNLAWLLFEALGLAVVVLVALKHFLDYCKTLW
jgi:hypothetical protein